MRGCMGVVLDREVETGLGSTFEGVWGLGWEFV
jgi:hypothetical protein